MVFQIRPSDYAAKHRMAVNGFASVEESEVAAIENEDYYNRFLDNRGYCSP
jgi:hypothetical protein